VARSLSEVEGAGLGMVGDAETVGVVRGDVTVGGVGAGEQVAALLGLGGRRKGVGVGGFGWIRREVGGLSGCGVGDHGEDGREGKERVGRIEELERKGIDGRRRSGCRKKGKIERKESERASPAFDRGRISWPRMTFSTVFDLSGTAATEFFIHACQDVQSIKQRAYSTTLSNPSLRYLSICPGHRSSPCSYVRCRACGGFFTADPQEGGSPASLHNK
jgi:hypothetical protein